MRPAAETNARCMPEPRSVTTAFAEGQRCCSRTNAIGERAAVSVRRLRDVADLPDLSAHGDDVGRVLGDLERDGPVQPVGDHRERAVTVDLEQLSGVRYGGGSRAAAERPGALGQGVQGFPPSPLYVDQERAA